MCVGGGGGGGGRWVGGISFEMPQFIDVSTALPFSKSVSFCLGASSY